MTDVQPSILVLLDRQDIVDVLMRGARAMDRRDAEMLRGCYHSDAIDEHGAISGHAGEVVDKLMAAMSFVGTTSHQLSTMLIDVRGTEALAETYFNAVHQLLLPDGERKDFTMVGRYLDRFEKRDGRWKISHRQVLSDHMTVTPSTDDWNGVLGALSIRGKSSTQDNVYAWFGLSDTNHGG